MTLFYNEITFITDSKHQNNFFILYIPFKSVLNFKKLLL